jgi:cyclopropane-fatty-acyl-phospholipid synthase
VPGPPPTNGNDPLKRGLSALDSASIASRATRVLDAVADGALRERAFGVRFWDGSELPATAGATNATLVVLDPMALAHVVRQPNELGLGRAWVAGALEVEGDLGQVLARLDGLDELSVSIRDRLRAVACLWRIGGPEALRRPPALKSEARPKGRRHSQRRDRTAVRHHYDVPDSFYRLVLGPTMVYSCAYFESRDDSLDQAQSASSS